MAAGFTVVDSGCCQELGEIITCLPLVEPCDDRDEYGRLPCMHPTQAANLVLAQRAFNGTPDHVYPVNLQQLVARL
ncbi:GDSL esterase/lipase [Panicum miliaceum]|uniref:GDSL esterase/lipase n=1 Tax=Panicum miliaceum TaxID=4540 RepID=A0A3L6PPI9_PANMI|nr:GDSL esterase/lipase [Panicum miliaceum]